MSIKKTIYSCPYCFEESEDEDLIYTCRRDCAVDQAEGVIEEIKYYCEECDDEFSTKDQAIECELSHNENNDSISIEKLKQAVECKEQTRIGELNE